MTKSNKHRSRFKRVFKAFRDVTPRPVNELATMASLGSGSDVTPEYKPDLDTDPYMNHWALINEVEVVVMACGKIAYRGNP